MSYKNARREAFRQLKEIVRKRRREELKVLILVTIPLLLMIFLPDPFSTIIAVVAGIGLPLFVLIMLIKYVWDKNHPKKEEE